MNFDELAYPEKIIIDGIEHKGSRKTGSDSVKIPYTNAPDVGIGDKITQVSGKRNVLLKVLDASFLKNGSLGVGTNHPHMLTLKVNNMTESEHADKKKSSTINIGSLNAQQVQVGDNNSQHCNISFQELVESVAKSDDKDAKSNLKSLLENSTVGSIVGAGAGTLLNLLTL
jgi:hypothetical protein